MAGSSDRAAEPTPLHASASSTSLLRRHPYMAASPAPPSSAASSIHDVPRPRKLRMLVAANGTRDTAYAQAIAVRFLKDAQTETRALLDDVPIRLTHNVMALENRSSASPATDAAQSAAQSAFELVEWADILVLAPIDADHLAKMMCGFADNTLLEILRAWDVSKKIIMVPGMSTQAWENPMTKKHLSKIKRKWSWIKLMPPILWHYDDANPKPIVSWDGFNDVIAIVKNQAELMSLGHDVEVAAQQALQMTDSRRIATTLPPEIWTLIFEHVGDWELAQAMGVYTTLPMPSEWRAAAADTATPLAIYMRELEWLILSCPGSPVICSKLSQAPSELRYITTLSVKLIIKFSLVDVLSYMETHMSQIFWDSFTSKLLANKASGSYGRTDILEWWNTSPSFLKKEYDAETLDNASRMGYVHVLDWWLKSGLTLKYTEAALEQASAKGHLLVLEWWRDVSQRHESVRLKPGRSLLSAAQRGQTAVLRWWESSNIPTAHSEGVCKIASAHGQIAVLDTWRELKGDKMSFDSQVLVAPTKQGHVGVLEWWKEYARGGDGAGEREATTGNANGKEGNGREHRVEYKTCDIEEAIEDAIGDPQPVRRWWARNGLNLSLRTSEWMKNRCI